VSLFIPRASGTENPDEVARYIELCDEQIIHSVVDQRNGTDPNIGIGKVTGDIDIACSVDGRRIYPVLAGAGCRLGPLPLRDRRQP
jgi:hypothetical protein